MLFIGEWDRRPLRCRMRMRPRTCAEAQSLCFSAPAGSRAQIGVPGMGWRP